MSKPKLFWSDIMSDNNFEVIVDTFLQYTHKILHITQITQTSTLFSYSFTRDQELFTEVLQQKCTPEGMQTIVIYSCHMTITIQLLVYTTSVNCYIISFSSHNISLQLIRQLYSTSGLDSIVNLYIRREKLNLIIANSQLLL